MNALIEIVAGNFWAVAARNLYKPIALSIGTVFTALKINDNDDQPMFATSGFNWGTWFDKEFEKKENET